MDRLIKAIAATTSAGALMLAGASPALARPYDRDDGIDAGDIIAGALIIGGSQPLPALSTAMTSIGTATAAMMIAAMMTVTIVTAATAA